MAIVAAGIIVALIILIANFLPGAFSIIFGRLLYLMVLLLFQLCDLLQIVFRRLAGLDTYWIQGNAAASVSSASEGKTGDILISLFTSDVVVEALISMTLFAVALLLIVTIVQIIRVEYTTEGSKNSKGTILGKAIKSFAMFILIPVVCFLGVFASNKILLSLDKASSQSGSTMLSGKIFLAGAADANVVRMGGTSEGFAHTGFIISTDESGKAMIDGDHLKNLKTSYFHSNKTSAEAKQNDLAKQVDEVMTRRYSILNSSTVDRNEALTVGDIRENRNSLTTITDGSYVHYSNIEVVGYFYDYSEMNWFIFFVGTWFVLMSLIKASIGLIMRLYKGTALFIISPAVTALTPIDDGQAYKSWRKAFIGCVLGAYGYVVALNLLFQIMGVIDNIYIFPDSNPIYYTANRIIQCLMVLVGVNMLTDFSGLISGFIGAEDALKTGEGMTDKVAKSAGKVAKVGYGATTFLAGGLTAAIGNKKVKKFGDKAAQSASQLSKEQDKLDKMDKTDPEYGKQEQKVAALQKEVKTYNKKHEVWSGRAAGGAKSVLRAKEMISDSFQDSELASFANTATGGLSERLGGKTLKKLDDKLKDDHQNVYDVAGKDPTPSLGSIGGWVAQKGTEIKKKGTKDGKFWGTVAQGAGGVLQTGKAIKSGVNYVLTPEQRTESQLMKDEDAKQKAKVVGEEAVQNLYGGGASLGYGTADDVKRYEGLNKLLSDIINTSKVKKGDDRTKKGEELALLLDQLPENARTKEIKEKAKDGLGAFHKYIKGVSADDVFDGDQGYALGHAKFVADHSDTELMGVNNAAEMEKIYRKADAARRPVAPPPLAPPPQGNGQVGPGGAGGGNASNMNINANGNINIDAKNKVDLKGDTTIKDANAMGDKIGKTIGKAMEDAKKAKEKDEKENKITEMLTKMSKTLDAIKKNTKK